MYERESSVASSVDFYESEGKLKSASEGQMQNDSSVAKRKAEDSSSAADKKRRLNSHDATSLPTGLGHCAGLPPAVWQHIFSFCSLADLGRLLQVNRLFHLYLTDVSNVSPSEPEHGCLHLLKSESLWASARNALSTNAPKPLPGLTELQMWQLVWSKRCQFCNKLNSSVPGEKVWQKGPGEAGVRIIWPFGIRACGTCLKQQTQTVSCEGTIFPQLLTLAGRKPSFLSRLCSSTCAAFCAHYERSELYPCASTTVSYNTGQRRNWEILLQEACRRHYTRAQRCPGSWFCRG